MEVFGERGLRCGIQNCFIHLNWNNKIRYEEGCRAGMKGKKYFITDDILWLDEGILPFQSRFRKGILLKKGVERTNSSKKSLKLFICHPHIFIYHFPARDYESDSKLWFNVWYSSNIVVGEKSILAVSERLCRLVQYVEMYFFFIALI